MLTRVFLRKLSQEAKAKQSTQLPAEVSEITVNTKLAERKRKQKFFEEAGNPYLLRHGTTQITLIYPEEGESLSGLLTEYFNKGGHSQ